VVASDAVVCDPLVALVPDQPPPPVQVVARVADHVSVVVFPETMFAGSALRVTTGGSVCGETVTVSDCCETPPGPAQDNANAVVAVSGMVMADPTTGFGPLQPPPAVQLVALNVLHDKVVESPDKTDAGAAVNVRTGGGMTPTEVTRWTNPPGPLQSRTKLLDVSIGPICSDPEAALAPDHPPLAVQLFAFAVIQDSVTMPPELTVDCEAVRVSEGGGMTLTETSRFAKPPTPTQLSVNVEVDVNGPTCSVALTALAPAQLPEAVQLDALVTTHESIVEPPIAMLAGEAENVIEGGGGAFTVMTKGYDADPPALLAVIV
jgi:hypothetical protein